MNRAAGLERSEAIKGLDLNRINARATRANLKTGEHRANHTKANSRETDPPKVLNL